MQGHQPGSWHDQALSELTTALNTDEARGLAPDEAAARLHQWGRNTLRTDQALSPLALLAVRAIARELGILAHGDAIVVGLSWTVSAIKRWRSVSSTSPSMPG